MFDIDDAKFPRSWKEMSLDFRLSYAFAICAMVLWVMSGSLTLEIEIVAFVAMALMIAIALVLRRRKDGWRWPGVRVKNVLLAAGIVALGCFFLGAATPLSSPLDPRMFPWFAFGGEIIIFAALDALKVTCRSQHEYLRACGRGVEGPPKPPMPKEASWKRKVRIVFFTYFMAVWVIGVMAFWTFGKAFRDGTKAPTPQRTEELVSHGKKVFITPDEKQMVTILGFAAMIGIPSALLAATAIQFGLRVKLFPNVPIPGRGNGGHQST